MANEMQEVARKMLNPEDFPVLMGFLDVDGQSIAVAAMSAFGDPADESSSLEARVALEALAVEAAAAFWVDLVKEAPVEIRGKLNGRFHRPQRVDRIYGCRALMLANQRNMTIQNGRKQIDAMIRFLDEIGQISDAFDALDGSFALAQSAEITSDQQTCSCCFQAVRSRDGKIFSHLFDSSGETAGQPIENCMGSKFPPLEVNTSGLEWRIENLKYRLQEKKDAYANRSSLEEIKIRHMKITPDDVTWTEEFTRYVISMEQEISAIDSSLKRATQVAAKRKAA